MNKQRHARQRKRFAVQEPDRTSIKIVSNDGENVADAKSEVQDASRAEDTTSKPDTSNPPDTQNIVQPAAPDAPITVQPAMADTPIITQPAVPDTPNTVQPAVPDGSSFAASIQRNIESSKFFTNYIFKDALSLGKYLWSLRAPLLLLAAIGVCPKIVILWILVVLLKPLLSLSFKKLSPETQLKISTSIPQNLKNVGILKDLSEGADQCLPFILFWLYLCCAPLAILWIAGHYVRSFFPTKELQAQDGLVFSQNRKKDLRQENNFYYSRAFAVTVAAVFALGIPAIFSYSVYKNLGVDSDLRKSPTRFYSQNYARTWLPPAQKPKFVGGFPSHPNNRELRKQNQNSNFQVPIYITSYTGYWPMLGRLWAQRSEFNVFFVHFYLVSLACALSVLFFRAWFFFPLNFLTDEHEVYLTARGIRRTTMRSWFLNVLTINRWATGGGPDSLDWSEIKSLRHLEEGFTRLSPLPETAFKKESLTYKLLNKIASFIDGLTNRVNTGNYLIFGTTEKQGDFGRNIKINLNDLSREQRAKLFYSVKNWAPHVVINQDAQESLLGSVVLQDARYTQLWFDLLTSRTKVKRQSVLTPGETLHEGAYTVEERLSGGGQATAYLAKTTTDKQVVLKEFILAISSAPGALLESAREFETEVSLLSQLKHPSIVKLEDFFTEEGRVYVVLEYVPGQTLRQKVQEHGALSEVEVIKFTEKICEVLEYLHKFDPPIVHRDITPENILILPDGSIKLIDFSLAVKSDGAGSTDSCGKQAFTPPEQFRDEVCPASDIYGLGATMYFLLTGLPPKPITPSSPKQKCSDISDKLNKIVERATQLDLSNRYDSIHWMKLDLAECLTATTNLDLSSRNDSIT